jgi:hypothetical protein
MRFQRSRSMPLCTTWTRAGSIEGYERRMSARMPADTAITASAASNAVLSIQLEIW